MTGWAGIVQAVLAFLGSLMGLRREVKAEAAGETKQRAADQQQVIQDVQDAQNARVDVQRDLAAGPDQLREPDEFTRPD